MNSIHVNEGEVDYDSLDPNIRETVRWLRARGFATSDSGDGSKAGEMECAEDFPHVYIMVAPSYLVAETARLLRELTEAVDEGTIGSIGDAEVFIQGTYDPANGSGIIELIGMTDNLFSGRNS